MKNKLKGVTLIETMLYIGLFSIIILIVVNFMLATNEATQRTNNRLSLFRSSQFIAQHLDNSFNKALSVDETNSTFGNTLDILQLTFSDSTKQYSIQNSILNFDGIPITPNTISVITFTLEPIYKDGVIFGINSDITIQSNINPNLTETLNLLSIIR